MSGILPPAHEGGLLPMMIDKNARDHPYRPWASVPYDDNDLTRGYEDISYKTLANAINRLAWMIDALIGKSTTFEIITYYGRPDLRYHMMQMAACKTGHAILFSSHLNSLDVHKTLMEKLKCKALFFSTGVEVDDILAARPMPSQLIPEFNDLLDPGEVAEWYPYSKEYSKAAYEPYMYIHTSGTTGNPKPVEVTHAMLYALTLHVTLPDVEGRKHVLDYVMPGLGGRVLLPVAPFHGISSLCGMMTSVIGEGVFVSPYRNRSVTPADPIADILVLSRAKFAFLVPYIMETVAKKLDPGRYIQGFKSVSFGGGQLSRFAQETWSKYTRIHNYFGATEIGFPVQLDGDADDFEYIYFDMKHSCIEFQEVKIEDYEDGGKSAKAYEMVLVWKADVAQYSGYYSRECGKSGPPYADYHIGDLWSPHPDPKKAHYVWRFVGRMDDVITLATGVNVNSGSIEKELMTSTLVKATLVVGNKRMQPLALIELAPGSAPDAIEDVWRTVVEPLNAKMQSQARIARTHLLVVPPAGLVRTVKGTVSRQKSERKFEKEIDDLYRKYGDVYQPKGRDEPTPA